MYKHTPGVSVLRARASYAKCRRSPATTGDSTARCPFRRRRRLTICEQLVVRCIEPLLVRLDRLGRLCLLWQLDHSLLLLTTLTGRLDDSDNAFDLLFWLFRGFCQGLARPPT